MRTKPEQAYGSCCYDCKHFKAHGIICEGTRYPCDRECEQDEDCEACLAWEEK